MTPRLLAIEDSPVTQRMVKEGFTALGCEVVPAPTAEKGIEILEMGNNFHVIILDFRLPGMSGPEFFRRISSDERWKKIAVVPFTFLLNSQYDNTMGMDWVSNSRLPTQEDPGDSSLPIVSKPQSEDVPELPQDLVLSVAYALRRGNIALPPVYKETFAKLVRSIF